MKTFLSLTLALSAIASTSSFIKPSQMTSEWECPYCGHINPHTERDCQKCES